MLLSLVTSVAVSSQSAGTVLQKRQEHALFECAQCRLTLEASKSIPAHVSLGDLLEAAAVGAEPKGRAVGAANEGLHGAVASAQLDAAAGTHRAMVNHSGRASCKTLHPC